MEDKPTIPSVINDLTTGGTTNALSAEQGKLLNNNKWTIAPVDYLNTGVKDFDDLTTPGTYLLWSSNINGDDFNLSHAPDAQGGLLIVHAIQ